MQKFTTGQGSEYISVKCSATHGTSVSHLGSGNITEVVTKQMEGPEWERGGVLQNTVFCHDIALHS